MFDLFGTNGLVRFGFELLFAFHFKPLKKNELNVKKNR